MEPSTFICPFNHRFDRFYFRSKIIEDKFVRALRAELREVIESPYLIYPGPIPNLSLTLPGCY
jgi:hypothetical protein